MTESVAVVADPVAAWMQQGEERVRPHADADNIDGWDGFRLGRAPAMASTLRRLENPLGSDGAYYLRRYLQQFPTAVDKRQLRDLRDQFLARLEGVA
jgi:hypothetical protein